MFRITDDPSPGSLVQCLAKNYKNDSFVSVDMDKAGVMAAYSDRFFREGITKCSGEVYNKVTGIRQHNKHLFGVYRVFQKDLNIFYSGHRGHRT